MLDMEGTLHWADGKSPKDSSGAFLTIKPLQSYLCINDHSALLEKTKTYFSALQYPGISALQKLFTYSGIKVL